ncbi:MAG: hypothetical protein IJG23_05535 [Clostridia bacterium]|nr:hypothetical protein [Clostridia bacterium]
MKRYISILLVIVMLFSIIPSSFSAYADSEDTISANQLEVNDLVVFGMWPYGNMIKTSQFSDISVTMKPIEYLNTSFKGTISAGDFTYFGDTYRKVTYQRSNSTSTQYFKWENIQWRVCDVSEQGVTLISDNVVDATPFSTDEEGCTYEESVVYRWLKEDFIKNAFNEYEATFLNSFTRFGYTQKATIPSVTDFEAGGMLNRHNLNRNIATGYPALTAEIRYAPSFSNCSSNCTVLAEDGVSPAYVDNSGTAYDSDAVKKLALKSNGIRPIIQLSGGTKLYFDVYRYFLAPHEHEYTRALMNENTLAQAGDCYHNDTYFYTCTHCDAISDTKMFEDENTTKHGPLTEIVSDETYKEDEDGLLYTAKYYYTCATCGQVIKQSNKYTNANTFSHVKPHEHEFELYQTITPTCLREGVKVYKCKLCFSEEKREVYAPALSHEPVKKQEQRALKYFDEENNKYYYYYTCSVCNHVLSDTLLGKEAPTFVFDANHEHQYRFLGSYEPTCTEKGYELYQCEICAQLRYDYNADELGHILSFNYSSQVDTTRLCSVKDYYKCSRCGKSYSVVGGHDYSVESDSLCHYANCMHPAQYYLKCKYCGDKNSAFTYTKDDVTTEHTLIQNLSDEALKSPATQTECAKYYYTCTTCGKVIKNGDTFEYHPESGEHYHNYVLSEIVEGKCGNARTLTGKRIYICECGKKFTVTTPQKQHTKGKVVYHFAPTCLNEETVVYDCPDCGEQVIERSGEILGHDFSKIGRLKRTATCYHAAQYQLVCSRCNLRSLTEVYTDPDSILPHQMELSQTIAPTCEEAGQYIYKCKNCSHSYTEPFGEPTGHNFELCDTIEPSCTESGKYVYRCQNCGDEKREDFGEALGHSGEYVRSEFNGVKFRTDYYLCSRCGNTYSQDVEHKHVYDTPSNAIAKHATCYNNEVHYYVCSDCLTHGIRAYGSATYEIEGTQYSHIPQRKVNDAALHSERTATAPATYYFTCGRCGEVLKEGEYENRYFSTGDLGHEHRYFCEVVQPLTCIDNGILHYTCQICGYSFDEVNSIARGSHAYRTHVKFAGDCTRKAYTLYECYYCRHMELEYTGVEPPGHQYTVKSDNLFKAATCTDDALYYLSCAACGDVSAKYTYAKDGTALDLEHIKTECICQDALRSKGEPGKNPTYFYTCSHCGDILKGEEYGFFTPQISGKILKEYPVGTTFEMGRWPQSLVEDSALITKLDTKTPTMYSYGYGYGISEVLKRIDASTDYSYDRFEGYINMCYGDIVLDGEKYRKVVVKHARVEDVWDIDEERDELFCGTYYFKWEPIEWIVFHSQDEQVTVLSELILDYAYTVRENENDADWLNGCFFKSAFSESERKAITANGCFRPDFETVKSNAGVIETAMHGLSAGVSHYSQLLSANRALVQGDKNNAFGMWESCDTTLKKYRYISSEIEKSRCISDSSSLEELGIRPAMMLRADAVPGVADAASTICTHEHNFCRKMITKKSIIKASNGEIYDGVKSSCICCAEVSDGSQQCSITSVQTLSAYDINRDGITDIADISIILTQIGKQVTNERYDYNNNGVIDTMDLSIILLSDNYGA